MQGDGDGNRWRAVLATVVVVVVAVAKCFSERARSLEAATAKYRRRPAAQATVAADGCVTLTALRDIGEGEEVTISYVDVTEPYDERRKTLMTHYGFECKCARCVAENRKELKQRMKERDIYMAGQRR